MRLNYCPGNKGLSLLELVVAVATLTLGISVVLQAFSASIRASAISQDTLRAIFIAEDKLQELEFKRLKDIVGEENSKDKAGKFEREYTLTRKPGTDLYKLDINIRWGRGSGADKLNLTTYLR